MNLISCNWFQQLDFTALPRGTHMFPTWTHGRLIVAQQMRAAVVQRVSTLSGKQRTKHAAVLIKQRYVGVLCVERAVYFKRYRFGDDLCECLHHFHDLFHIGNKVSQPTIARMIRASLRLDRTHGQTPHGISRECGLVPCAVGSVVANVAAGRR